MSILSTHLGNCKVQLAWRRVRRASVRSTGLERQMCGGGPPGYGGGLKDTEEDEKPFSY